LDDFIAEFATEPNWEIDRMAEDSEQLPPLPTVRTIERRLQLIFPEGTPNRSNATAERAARTAFVMLYVGAVENAGIWARPDQVTRMSDAQASKISARQRASWRAASLQKAVGNVAGRWYSVNSREGIRDDTLRYAWQPLGVVVERTGLATTSSTPRWALAADFAAILTWGVSIGGEPPNLSDLEKSVAFTDIIEGWQTAHLSTEARARIQIMRRVTGASDSVPIVLPDGSIRRLAPGDSSLIAKAVVEQFSLQFMVRPAVLWLSDSRDHVDLRDNALAESIGLSISDAAILPDLILVDTNPNRLLLVFCEIVATDGPMNELRKNDILRLVRHAGFNVANVAFMTAFLDRDSAPYRKLVSTLAWGSLSWTASEPDKLTLHIDGSVSNMKLADALDMMHSVPARRRP
jgi:BsuBI/PstI restriction endonuclease domain/BsuBI/PstI restriction endonuclease HTH domain